MLTSNHWVLTIDTLLERAGNNGNYQLKSFILIGCQWLISSFFLMGYKILFIPPVIMCYDTNADPSTAVLCSEEIACSPDKIYYFDESSVKSIIYSFKLVCDDSYLINTCQAALFIGGGLGAYFYAEFQEKKGRLSTLIDTVSFAGIISMLSIFSFNIYVFAAASFLIHFAIRGLLCSSVVYFTEISDDNYRVIGPCFFYGFWGLGQMIFAILTYYFSSSWTFIMFYFIGVPFLISAFYLKFMKESPRYCVVQYRFKEAKESIMGIAKINNRAIPDFSLEEEIKLNNSTQLFASTLQESYKTPERRFKYHMLTLFKYYSLKKPSFVILYFMSLLTILFYDTSLSIDTIISDPYTNQFIIGFIQLISYLFAANSVLNYRRKSCFRTIYIIIALSYLFFTLFKVDIQAAEISTAHMSFFIIFVVSSKAAVSAGMAFLTVYICELYPTVIRHFAYGFYDTFTKLAVVLIPQYVGFTEFIKIGPIFPITCFSLGTLYMMTYLPETKDKSIEDYIEEEKPLLYDKVDKEMHKLYR